MTPTSLAAPVGRALAVRHPAPAQLQQGLTQGLTGLAGSVTAGISGVFTAPIAGAWQWASIVHCMPDYMSG